MKSERKYQFLLAGAAMVYLIILLLTPQKHEWSVTLYHRDKGPFGTYVLNELISGVFPGKLITHSNLTAYEWFDSIPEKTNFVTLTMLFNPPKEDVDVMLRYVEKGGNLFISAENFFGIFADTLKVNTSTSLIAPYDETNVITDSTILKFADNLTAMRVKRGHVRSYFNMQPAGNTEALAYNEEGFPVFIRIRLGKGAVYLNSTPLVFTNIYMLHDNNTAFSERCLIHLPDEDVFWTEYYHRGRQEVPSPLRYILTVEPLRWAYYITLGSLFLYMVFAARRRQRPIPVVKPPPNTTLEFVQTIGNLYLRAAEHKRIAEKRMAAFLENLRNRLHLPGLQPYEDMVEAVSHKTGHPQEEVRQLFALIRSISQKPNLSENELKDFSKKLDKLTNTADQIFYER